MTIEKKINISPELEVLLWAMRIEDQKDDTIEDTVKNVNWAELAKLAQRYQMGAFLYHQLKNFQIGAYSEKIDFYFKDTYRLTLQRNLFHARQLLGIIQELSHHNVEVVPFKGIVLAHQAYQIPELRLCTDIDILINPEDLSQVIKILNKIGLKSHNSSSIWPVQYFINSIMRSESFSGPYFSDVDVHWKISDVFSGYQAEKDFFKNAKIISILGSEIPTLSPEDTLIMLSAHGMKHFWQGLRPVNDIISLINNSPALDFSGIISSAKEKGCLRLLNISLFLAQFIGKMKYPRNVQITLQCDSESFRIARYIFQTICQTGRLDPNKRLIAMIQSRERWGGALGFGLYALFSWPQPEGSRLILPRPFRPIYPIIPPFFKKSK